MTLHEKHFTKRTLQQYTYIPKATNPLKYLENLVKSRGPVA